MSNGYTLVDSPLTWYSSMKEIDKWLKELRSVSNKNKQILDAIKEAEKIKIYKTQHENA